MVEKNDTILVHDILSGNKIAQEKLYNKYQKIVKNFLMNRYSKKCDIDDDVSEIMIRVFLNLKTFDSAKSKFGSWVLTIARNHMVDKWRKSNVNIIYIPSYETNTSFSNSVSDIITYHENQTSTTDVKGLFDMSFSTSQPDDKVFENGNMLNHALSQLSLADFTLLNMKYVQGYDYYEIANEFQLTSSTVSNKINYIKTKLKKSIGENS